jgi:hypothetical protein
MEPEGRDKVIRDRVAAGVLPRTDPRSVWVGYGSGRPCDGCVQPVRPAQREYHADYGPGLSLRLHHACYEFWEVERRRPADPGSG